MIEAKLKFESEAQKAKYVHVCDDRFEADVDAVMKELCARKELRYLTLSGPSCSGKTTASRKVRRRSFQAAKNHTTAASSTLITPATTSRGIERFIV